MLVRFLIDVHVTSKHEDVLDLSSRKQTEINTKMRRNKISPKLRGSPDRLFNSCCN